MTSSATLVQPPRGRVALRLVLFEAADKELADALLPPWPRWMKRMYELEQGSNEQVDPDAAEVPASAALSTLSEKLKHRLDLLSFVCGVLEENGWHIELDGEALIATARMNPYEARHMLDDVGVAGPMSFVTDLDDSGWPRLWYGGDD